MDDEAMLAIFADRTDAGRRLARKLSHLRNDPKGIVIGLPRGGVITAAAVAKALALPLDVVVVRKLGAPGQEELAMGAIGPGGVRILNDDVIAEFHVTLPDVDVAVWREALELERRERVYRAGLPLLDLKGKRVILVDDGLATGATMAAAIEVIRRQGADSIVLAVPVAPKETCDHFRERVDELVCLERPDPFGAIGYWYESFAPVSDDEVVRALAMQCSRIAA